MRPGAQCHGDQSQGRPVCDRYCSTRRVRTRGTDGVERDRSLSAAPHENDNVRLVCVLGDKNPFLRRGSRKHTFLELHSVDDTGAMDSHTLRGWSAQA